MTRYPLREIVAAMAASDAGFPACEEVLCRIGEVLKLPRVGFVPDIARPYFSADADAFFRRHGWPDELLSMWWDKRAPIKTGLYIRCRFAALPFAASIVAADEQREGASAEEREMTRLFVRHGLTTLVAVPVHLPRGQIALLVFAGDEPIASVREMLPDVVPDLLAAGHLTSRAWDRVRPSGAVDEELSRLTQREWDCLRLLAQGCRDAEIARLNGISVTTVRYHVENVVQKLGAVNRIHAVALACQLGIIGPLGH